MRIAQLSPLHEAVPPQRYGGTERVLSWLTDELVRRGHEVTLFASGDSRTKAELVPVTPVALRPCRAKETVAPHFRELALLRDRLGDFDVVHSHLDFMALPFRRPTDPPLVTTLHGRLDLPEFFPIYDTFRAEHFVSISNAQRLPVPLLDWVATVYHGLPLDEYTFGEGKGDYVLFLGRMSPEKRPHAAIDIARKLGIRLVIAAKVDAADRDYYEEAIVPRLQSGSGVDFVGETELDETIRLLGAARALLFPIDWPEPFGLAMIEAMACGTPVVTRRCGSTPELIHHGTTGFVCDDDDEIALALRKLDRLDRAACREAAATRFSVERMADDYEAVYRRLVRERMSRWTTSSAFTIDTTSSRPQGSPTTELES